MKLSLFIGAEHRPTDSMTRGLSEYAEQVRLARQIGFDGVLIGNHLSYSSTVWFPPFETLMRLAAEADGMSLGTCMLILPLYEPLHVAQQVACSTPQAADAQSSAWLRAGRRTSSWSWGGTMTVGSAATPRPSI